MPHLGQHAVVARAVRGDHRHACVFGNFVVAVNPRDFFDQIDLARQVTPPGGGNHFHQRSASRRSCSPPSARQNPPCGVFRHVDAQNSLELCVAQRDRLARLRLRSQVDHAGCQFAAGQFQNQLARAAAGPIDPFRIEPALEAIGRIAVQAQSPGRVADGERIELGRFDQNLGGGRADFGQGTAHHAAQADGARGVGNDAHAGLERVGLVVDGYQRLAGTRFAHDDLAAFELRQVEGVQRLPAFHQHVVGNVDHVVDRRNADRGQAVGQPGRARLDAHAANHPRRIAAAERRAVDADLGKILHSARAFARRRRRQRERPIEQHGRLARDTDMAQAVGPIAGHFQVDGEVAAVGLGRLVVEPGHHQPLGELIGGHVEFDVLAEPIPGDEHGLANRRRRNGTTEAQRHREDGRRIRNSEM